MQLTQDDLHRENYACNRGVERSSNARCCAAGYQVADAIGRQLQQLSKVEPRAAPTCTIGPSRPAEPPLPIQTADAAIFATTTRGRIRPPRNAMACMTSGTPCPLASLAKKAMIGTGNQSADRRDQNQQPAAHSSE